MFFENRQEAGKKLAGELFKYRSENPYVLAMPRGGVPIGFEVAEVLHAPLSVIVVRKIGLSGNREFGIGAIAEGGVKVLDQTTIEVLAIDEEEIKDTLQLEEEELKRRVKTYRGKKPLPDLTGRTAVLVDDGMATGITAKAAIESVKKLNPQKIVLAIPVCALDTVEGFKKMADEVICLAAPAEFMAVGLWYKNFAQISDEEVVDLLKKAENFKRV
ncbi:MAG: Phosphoribosyltransferase [Candidatus Daviesbacteria bacterium GW2011_GWA1_41_61]|uniref:Phosphoribosyltransferase n=1 Tax=Candidatus Daviesbacteria bacterium GW2011_GWA2_40_9 TaxID=1618424 RepID=A0A0G0U7N5_9BACT|nr:MAG: Phosphoribosyltransferase [Candidatus Daviesbacteria bacterium GW2011_GWC1_40_9]KKR83216.1 MAG: Phosphoribosyltransferase [Candidatus Daviesbacteria bacterium GW2011_GWA2_40_9]KKR93561.1 MAG: Phosphoribosyltransferase [Candidatus Daviesbacteria bacterium GW2011_GWB1_41_15]KKS14888.1 MAG: Phosphoribosyltransferase [Candidatus Daviesbacteria bacterium GW2011_GWA1_41_61]